MLLILIMFLASLQTTVSVTECFTKEKTHKAQQQCLKESGINITVPSFNPEDSYIQQISYLEAFADTRLDFLCTKPEPVTNALKCGLEKLRNCVAEEYRGYLSDPSKVSQLVSTICSSVSSINTKCVIKKPKELFDCGLAKSQKEFRGKLKANFSTIVCKSFQFGLECQRSILSSCGCSTVRTYEKVSRDYLYPPSCPRSFLPEPPVECDNNNQTLFVSAGSKQPILVENGGDGEHAGGGDGKQTGGGDGEHAGGGDGKQTGGGDGKQTGGGRQQQGTSAASTYCIFITAVIFVELFAI